MYSFKFNGNIGYFVIINIAFQVIAVIAGLLTIWMLGLGALPIAVWNIIWCIKYIIEHIQINKE